MSDSITDRIAAIITEHRFGVRQWRDGYRHSSCMCIEEIGANEHSAHVAGAIVEQLGLIPQWAAAAALDGGYVVTRYVTKWEAE